MQPVRSSPLDKFEQIEIINLPKRSDRRRAVRSELRVLNTLIDGVRVSFLPAFRPDDPAGFDTVGTRGCFLSHLAALKKAQHNQVKSLLILEDDVAFSATERDRLSRSIEALTDGQWDIFYGGSPVQIVDEPLTKVAPDVPVLLAHFIAFSSEAIDAAVPYLEAMLERPAGSDKGGPMHVDGAYSWLRRTHPHLTAFAATPIAAHQRSSGTDIHVRRGLDSIPVLRNILGPMRALKNWRRSRH